jgi:hypothetical protein
MLQQVMQDRELENDDVVATTAPRRLEVVASAPVSVPPAELAGLDPDEVLRTLIEDRRRGFRSQISGGVLARFGFRPTRLSATPDGNSLGVQQR